LFALTTAVANVIREENPSLSQRIVLVPCPIDWPLLAKASAQSQNVGPVRIGYVGRLNEEKGIELLFTAAARLAERKDLPDWKLVLRGPIAVPAGGSGEAWLAELTTRFGPTLGARLEILPPEFDPAKLAAHYGSIDVFAYPSLAEAGETFGIAVAEAMAAGCAPVVSSLDCFADLITNGSTGLVFDHRSPRAASDLAACLAQLVAEPIFRQNMGRAATADVQRFDYSQITRLSEDAFQSLLRAKSIGNK
jgi:glycosyltransferase involved in cell wall biosynthesis